MKFPNNLSPYKQNICASAPSYTSPTENLIQLFIHFSRPEPLAVHQSWPSKLRFNELLDPDEVRGTHHAESQTNVDNTEFYSNDSGLRSDDIWLCTCTIRQIMNNDTASLNLNQTLPNNYLLLFILIPYFHYMTSLRTRN